jgi:predicted small secreted protein
MKHSPLRLIAAALIAVAAVVSLSSCHTAEGLGEDMEHAGRGIERAVERAR